MIHHMPNYLVGSPRMSWSLLESPSNSSDQLKDLFTKPKPTTKGICNKKLGNLEPKRDRQKNYSTPH